ncbi:helix-turn-helix domain-containing protein [Hyphomicrobium facile]|uniref:AraC-type DNA-binding protein n=1 Tax=Hyphomicrobium facile TaxID=51670 RepID=A0A1I7NQ45_9HYPH|nr:helix-turn-helix domain-containing protein [Hyphomicrobium facile]SFV36804.1 AraC-type DNA-binding protein [Hyphomicrobium facile]
MYREFSVQSTPLPQRARSWQEAVSQIILPFEASFRHPDSFNAILRSWDLGTASLTWMRTDSVRYIRRVGHVQSDHEENILVSFSSHSDVCFEQDGIRLQCPKKQFFIEKGREPSDFLQTDSNEIWVLKIPLASVKRHIRSLDPFYGRLFDGDSGVGGLLFDMVQQVPHRFGFSDDRSAEGVGNTFIELLVLAIESHNRAVNSSQSSVQRAHLSRVERFVKQNIGNPNLSLEMIAGACNISVRYLHTLFQGSGTSIAHWIRDMRLEACRAQLSETNRRERISEIAYRWGFSDQAQFSRHFKSRYGMTPREMRATAVQDTLNKCSPIIP